MANIVLKKEKKWVPTQTVLPHESVKWGHIDNKCYTTPDLHEESFAKSAISFRSKHTIASFMKSTKPRSS